MNLEPHEHPVGGFVFASVELDGGRVAYVAPLTFGRARLNIGDRYSVEHGY